MNKMIISVFDTEEKAYEGLSALKSLHQQGDITLYAEAVVNKNENGKITIKDAMDEGPIGTAVGMFSGSLIGMVAGPPGMAVGAMLGSLGGLFFDVGQSDFEVEFLDEVSDALHADKTAVIAEVDEAWTMPVNSRMEELGAMVFRRNKQEVVDDQLNREVDEINAEIDELKDELKDANDDMKANIQKNLDKAKAKQKALKEQVDTKLADIKSEADAKYNKLKSQMDDANQARKEKLEKRMDKLKANMKKRKKKLKKSAAKLKEYIS